MFELRLFVTGSLLLALSACASATGRYPSLALREVERPGLGVSVPPSAAPAPGATAPDPARIAALTARAAAAHESFTALEPGTAALIARARGAGAESEIRARALVALADLTAARSATFVPLGELDRLAADTAADYGDTAAIAAAQSAVLAMIAQQDRALGEFWGELGQ